jgi:hypothetical protein
MKRLFLFFTLLGASISLHAQTVAQGAYGAFFRSSTATNTATLTVDQMVGLLNGTPTGAATYTTPTATQLCNAFPSTANYFPSATFGILWAVINTSGGANTITIAGGTGVTAGTTLTVAQNNSRLFLLFPTSCVAGSQAWTLQSIAAGGTF